MKRLTTAALLSLCSIGAASAQTPVGEWLVKDQTAHIRIVPCGDALWGVINWVKGPPGKDENNPDPAKRNRSVMGLPILINFKREDSQWAGDAYNAENGKTYSTTITLQGPDVLRIEGCVLGFLCGGEDWTRVPLTKGSPPDQAVCSGVGK